MSEQGREAENTMKSKKLDDYPFPKDDNTDFLIKMLYLLEYIKMPIKSLNSDVSI